MRRLHGFGGQVKRVSQGVMGKFGVNRKVGKILQDRNLGIFSDRTLELYCEITHCCSKPSKN